MNEQSEQDLYALGIEDFRRDSHMNEQSEQDLYALGIEDFN